MDDPTGASSGSDRVCRGDGWPAEAPACRASFRDWLPPGDRRDCLGFRVARLVSLSEDGAPGAGQPKRESPPTSATPPPAAVLASAAGKPTGPTPPLAIAPFDAETAKQHQEAWAKHLGVPVEMSNSIRMRFVLIPLGEFEFSPEWNRKGQRVTNAEPFYLGQFEVTQEQYYRITGNNPSKFQGDTTRPVENVAWNMASDFCRKLSELSQERAAEATYRLPTQREWEYALRAGADPWEKVGEYAPELLSQYAWHKENSEGQTHPVGQLRPNAWGLFDMRGNVWEWLADTEGDSGKRIIRGHSYRCEPGEGFRWLYRWRATPHEFDNNWGLRVVRSLVR